jgi:lipoprotein-releasing system ATP-binding protein
LIEIVKETGLSALIATHNLELASKMDRQVQLKDGQLLDLRPTVNLKKNKNFY